MAISGRALARRQRARRWLGRLLLGAVVLLAGAMGYAFYVQISTVLELRGEQATLQLERSALARENAALQQRLSLQNDPDYLEYMVRKLLGWVRPGETKYILPPDTP